ncbi:MAG: mechanosensitive ion channel domain-containing protein [Myxococcota bacterium]
MNLAAIWMLVARAEPVEESTPPLEVEVSETELPIEEEPSSPEETTPMPTGTDTGVESGEADEEPASAEPVHDDPPHAELPPVPAPTPIPTPPPEPQGPPPERIVPKPVEIVVEPPPPPPRGALDERIEAVFDQLVPTLNRRGPQALFGLALFAFVSLGAAGLARSFRARLRPIGILPSLMVGTEIFGRAIAVVVALTAIVALLPVGIVPALTWIAIGAAIAVGWSLREILPDVLAWVVLATEGQLARGVWIRSGDYHGAIDSFTLRSVWIVDAHGQRISIPNRVLLQQPIQAATESFPQVHVAMRLPNIDATQARTVLWESAMLSPWLAPSTTPSIGQDPSDPDRWHVSVELLEGAYEDDFAGSFPERVHEVLAAHTRADA